MQIQPIRTEQDHEAAIARISDLMSAEPGTPEFDELDVLATLVDAYETKHFPRNSPDPITAIEFRMEQQGLTRKNLEPMIGSRARVSEVMTGKRPLTLEMIRRLSTGLGIPADVLMGMGSVQIGNRGGGLLDKSKKVGVKKAMVAVQGIC